MPSRSLAAVSLRTRLAILVAIAILPLAALHGTNLQQQIQLRLEETGTRAEQLARLAAGQYGNLLDQARGVLATLASNPAVMAGDPETCAATLRTIAGLHTWTSTIVIAGPEGRVRCSSLPGGPGIDLSDRAYFREVVATGREVVSDLLIGRVSGQASINVAVPIRGADGALTAVAVAGVYADRLSDIARAMATSVRGTVVAVIDGSGTIAARHPEPTTFVGRSMSNHPMTRTVLAEESGVYTGVALDGVERIVGFAPIGPHARLTLGFDRAGVLHDAYRTFWSELFGTFAVIAIIAGLIFMLADRLVLRGLADLESAAAALGAGREPRVVPGPWAAPEVRRLADAFGAMARAIRSRESQLLEARTAAEAGERAKSAFLSTMSHEIRTPLNGVIGFAQVLLDTPLTPQQREYAEMQMEAGHALLALINDVLDLSRIEAGKFPLESTPFEIGRLVEHAASMVEVEALRKDLAVTTRVDAAAPAAVVGDPTRVRQIVLNFLSNAVKFTDRGKITVSVLPGPDGRGLRIEVEDTGIGIPEDRQHELFRTFSQVHQQGPRQYGGTGLGLSISRHLAELMGGGVGVRSVPGRGATFWVDLPLDAVAVVETSRPPSPPTAPAAKPAGSRILVVDDLEMNRVMVRALLAAAGHAVDLAGDGEDGVRMAARGGYAAVLMDLRMPGIDGLEATRRIRALPPPAGTVPILGLSASVQPVDVLTCREAGMDGHVPKPVEKGVLLDALAGVIATTSAAPATGAPSFDANVLRALADDLGRETAIRLLRLMIAGVERHVGTIERAGEDRKALGFAAHSLIALGGSLGFMGLSDRARRLEEACEDPDAATGPPTEALLACAAETLSIARDEMATLTDAAVGAG